MTILNARPNTNTVGFQVFMDVVKRANFLQAQLDQAQAELDKYHAEDAAIERLIQAR